MRVRGLHAPTANSSGLAGLATYFNFTARAASRLATRWATTMNQILYDELARLARARSLAAYSDVSPLVGLSMENESDREEIARLLGEIAVYEHSEGRPMLTALIVHRGNDNNPGEGFFSIAHELGLYNGRRDQLARLTFWANQVTDVHNYWRNA